MSGVKSFSSRLNSNIQFMVIRKLDRRQRVARGKRGEGMVRPKRTSLSIERHATAAAHKYRQRQLNAKLAGINNQYKNDGGGARNSFE